MKKYPELTVAEIDYIEDIKVGFVNPGVHPAKPLGKPEGCNAMASIFAICRDVLRHAFPDEHLASSLRVTNVGGGPTDCTINCVVATYDDLEDRSEEAAMEFLSETVMPEKQRKKRHRRLGARNVKEYVPDTQVCSREAPTRDCFLTGQVTSCIGAIPNDEFLHHWMQMLMGLKRSDTTYGTLIKPDQGMIFELCVESKEGRKYKRLATKSKTWCFYRDPTETHGKFQVEQFIDFVTAITGIMLKHKPIQLYVHC